jgi:hypothetical protein
MQDQSQKQGGNAKVYSLDSDTMLYTKVQCISSVEMKKTMWILNKDDKGNEMCMGTM